ncbi:MAG: hypothetical protein ABIN48_11900 [Ginsengibacter sp.]
MSKLLDVSISGSLENLVFYRRMGKDCVRTKRKSIQQTDATMKRGLNFGIAAKAGRGLRAGLQEVMPLPKDRSAQSWISGAIAKWLAQSDIGSLEPTDDVPFISDLAFVEDKGFYTRFKAPLHISQFEDIIQVNINAFTPSKEITAPAKTVSVKLILSVSGCQLPGGDHTSHETHSIIIPYNDTEIPAMEFNFHVAMPPRSLIVTAGRLIYYQSSGQIISEIDMPAFMAAGVINARYGGGEE